MSASGSAFVEDAKIGVRLKISALWVVLLFLYAYGDIFGFFKPGQIEDVVSGEISGIDITEGFLFAVSVYVAIASVMIFLTLVLRPAAARRSNLLLAIVYIATIVAMYTIASRTFDRRAAAGRRTSVRKIMTLAIAT